MLSYHEQKKAPRKQMFEYLSVLQLFLPISRFCKQAQCLKITEKVTFNIASEASYVYILSGQKLIKNAKTGPLGQVLKT